MNRNKTSHFHDLDGTVPNVAGIMHSFTIEDCRVIWF